LLGFITALAPFFVPAKEDMDLTSLLIHLHLVASHGFYYILHQDFLLLLSIDYISLQNLLSAAFIRNLFAKGMDWGISWKAWHEMIARVFSTFYSVTARRCQLHSMGNMYLC
jgi:hypothetical protein